MKSAGILKIAHGIAQSSSRMHDDANITIRDEDISILTKAEVGQALDGSRLCLCMCQLTPLGAINKAHRHIASTGYKVLETGDTFLYQASPLVIGRPAHQHQHAYPHEYQRRPQLRARKPITHRQPILMFITKKSNAIPAKAHAGSRLY